MQGCTEEFRKPVTTFFTLFRMMLNMYDYTSLNIDNREICSLLHILYVLLIGILLVNFLIAIMTTSASQIEENEEVVLKINQLAVVAVLENRIYQFTKNFLYKKWRKYGFLCKDGHCYILAVKDKHSYF